MMHVVRFYRSPSGRWYGRCGCAWFTSQASYSGVKLAAWAHERQGVLIS